MSPAYSWFHSASASTVWPRVYPVRFVGKIFEHRKLFQETGPELPEVGKWSGKVVDLDTWSIPQPKKNLELLKVTFEADRHANSNLFRLGEIQNHRPFNAEDYIALPWVAPL